MKDASRSVKMLGNERHVVVREVITPFHEVKDAFRDVNGVLTRK
jgi:hypothetical protein